MVVGFMVKKRFLWMMVRGSDGGVWFEPVLPEVPDLGARATGVVARVRD